MTSRSRHQEVSADENIIKIELCTNIHERLGYRAYAHASIILSRALSEIS